MYRFKMFYRYFRKVISAVGSASWYFTYESLYYAGILLKEPEAQLYWYSKVRCIARALITVSVKL